MKYGVTLHQLVLTVAALTLVAVLPTWAAVTCTNENTAVVETTPTADFTDNGDGTVTDIKTGLMWSRCSLGQIWDSGSSTCTGTAATYTWQQALDVIVAIDSGTSDVDGDGAVGFAGYTDWRLPNEKELGSIFEASCWSPAINEGIFPGTPSDVFWSSSPYVTPPHAGFDGAAWTFRFGDGTAIPDGVIYMYYVRLVRAGQ